MNTKQVPSNASPHNWTYILKNRLLHGLMGINYPFLYNGYDYESMTTTSLGASKYTLKENKNNKRRV